MPFAITAEFPLGYYQGKSRSGVVEHYPSLLRLHAALVAAAYSTARLRSDEEAEADSAASGASTSTLDPTDADALDWLERHAPDAISLPRSSVNTGGAARAYRRKGWVQSATADGPDKPAASEPVIGNAALDQPVSWWWNEEPSTPITAALDNLCHEVPYLGEVQSVVRLRVETQVEPPAGAYVRDETAAISRSGAESFDLPTPGRSAELQRAYLGLSNAKPPSTREDYPKSPSVANAEKDNPDEWSPIAVRQQVPYVSPVSHAETEEPWTIAYLLSVAPIRPARIQYWRPRPDARVAWTLAVHRAIAKLLGDNASPLFTGRYPKGVTQPPNRVSIQVLDVGTPLSPEYRTDRDGQLGSAQILIALPPIGRGTTPEDVDNLESVLERLMTIARTSDDVVEIREALPVDATALWEQPAESTERWWFPHPLLVAENRAPKRSYLNGRQWDAQDAIRVAIANVFRDQPELSEVRAKGDRRLVELSEAVFDAGVRIGGARPADPVNPGRYVHHTNPHTVVTTVQGLIHLGPFAGDRNFLALGQSRHFGGGLLVPCDLPHRPEAISSRGEAR